MRVVPQARDPKAPSPPLTTMPDQARCFFTGQLIDLTSQAYVTFPLRGHAAVGHEYATRFAYIRFVNDHGVRQAILPAHRNCYAEHAGQGWLFRGDDEC